MKNTIRNLVKYIPKGLVLRFKEKGVENEVGGTNTNLTLMFTDIEGFSSISEKIDRTMDLTVHLSNYFDELAKIISKNDGIIDKFIGDAIMCFWGAPDKDEQQETKACRTALSCKRRLDILNAYWEFVGKPVFKTRFGIHSGNCVVGNIGSKDRFNYTALGDNVNLAARLEGANKIFSTSIIISDSVKNKLPPNFITRLLDTVAVKGKKKEVEIFELCGIQNEKDFVPVSDDAIQYFKKFEVMVRHYRVKEFSKALDILTELQSLPYAANDTELLNLYFTRCANHIALPVGDDWDGVTHLTEK
jgi:adenylate cyclase